MRFILTPVNTEKQAKRIKGSLVKDIRRQFWTDLTRSIILWVRALGSISINHRPQIKALVRRLSLERAVLYYKSFQLRWYHLVIAILATLLLSPHAGAVQSTAPSVKTVKFTPQKTLKQPPEAPQAQLAAIAVAPPTPPPAPVLAPVVGCGADPAMAFIYQHESGCNTASINASSGACGLGQALPCSKMGCSLSDWACQNAFFVNYAVGRYGSTAAAMSFWLSNSWW